MSQMSQSEKLAWISDPMAIDWAGTAKSADSVPAYRLHRPAKDGGFNDLTVQVASISVASDFQDINGGSPDYEIGEYYYGEQTDGIATRLISQGENYLTPHLLVANARVLSKGSDVFSTYTGSRSDFKGIGSPSVLPGFGINSTKRA